MELDNRLWSTLEGGYRSPYNAARPLRRLGDATRPDEVEGILEELRDNLHYRGNVGLASYLAVPHIISICIDRRCLDANFIGLCLLIENCRINGNNPELPREYESVYFDSLRRLEEYLLLNFISIGDRTALRLTLALFAMLNGQPGLGRAIEILGEEELPEFLADDERG
jgi:hypothetical protein